MAKVEILGEEELFGKLRRMTGPEQTTAMVSSLAAGIAIVQHQAERTAPRAAGGPTYGRHMAEQIGAEVNKASPNKAVGRVAPEKSAWRLIFAELGTKHHAAQPFLRRSLIDNKDITVRAMGEVYKDFVRKAAL